MMRAWRAMRAAVGRWLKRAGRRAEAGEEAPPMATTADLARLETALLERLAALDRAISVKCQAQVVLLTEVLGEVLVTELRRSVAGGAEREPQAPARGAEPAAAVAQGAARQSTLSARR
jgi:hypothetical protein